MTKETLLKYDGFIDNEYLDQYLELVSNLTGPKDYGEYHHIIPATGYGTRKDNSINKANTDLNQEIVCLSFADHCKAHWLLLNCTEGLFNDRLVYAFCKMLRGFSPNRKSEIIENGLTDADLVLIQNIASIKHTHKRHCYRLVKKVKLKELKKHRKRRSKYLSDNFDAEFNKRWKLEHPKVTGYGKTNGPY